MKLKSNRSWFLRILAVVLAVPLTLSSLSGLVVSAAAVPDNMKSVITVSGQNGHLQGFEPDDKNEFLYWSFTDKLVKTDMRGNIVKEQAVTGGHFGDLAYYDGKIYASMQGAPQ
ncbi:MAG: hypothetical protein RR444_09590 [Oscillospiraceae bacterium]